MAAKRSVMAALITLAFLNAALPVYAADNPITKFSRGLCNLVTFQFEIIEQSKRVKTEHGSAAAMTYGLAKGIAMAGVRALVGAYEVVTFSIPYPASYRPILTDPISFFPEEKKG
jgi:putative exosortase-associated protein (TIGR04073 family)